MQGVHHVGLRNFRAIGEARSRAAGFFGARPRSFQRSRRSEADRYNPRVTSLSPLRAAAFGGLTVGALDLLDAFVFFGLRSGARPIGILHSIAAGVLGRDAARAGGLPAAALGLALHFLVAFIIASIYVLASRYVGVLRRRWLVCGIAYGFIAYFMMTLVVVPLSNAGPGHLTLVLPVTPVLINGLAIHALGVGLPSAYFAARSRGRK